jgi:hypothetical protein
MNELLRDEQLKAVELMKNGCILNGGVGSGKSRTALYYYFTKVCGGEIGNGKKIKRMTEPRPLYVITTAAKRDKREWQLECLPFCLSQDVVVDSWNNIGKYVNVIGGFFIFDEDRITGNGKWVKHFYKIAKKNKWVVLSATPGDTWEQYIPIFVANGFYKNRSEFLQEHAVYSRYCSYPKIDKYIGINKLVRLRNSILIPMDVTRYTVRHDVDVDCEYDKDTYRSVMRSRWDPYKDEPIQQASGLCYVLRKIVNTDDSRQAKLLEILEKTDRAIVFYNFDYELDILKSLDYGKKRVAEWNGHAHEPIPKTKRWIYLVQYSAGCEGWNCTMTDTIIFFSQTYSYKTLEQARGRIDRINTGYKDLYYYHLVSKSKIDLSISMALHNKKNFNEGKFYLGL